MRWMLVFFGLGCFSVAVIAAAFWDYRTRAEKARRQLGEWTRVTSTTMTGSKSGYVIITYEKDDRR